MKDLINITRWTIINGIIILGIFNMDNDIVYNIMVFFIPILFIIHLLAVVLMSVLSYNEIMDIWEKEEMIRKNWFTILKIICGVFISFVLAGFGYHILASLYLISTFFQYLIIKRVKKILNN